MLIIEQAYYKSLELMRRNSSSQGFLAAGKSDEALTRGYRAVFARDAMICALGALSSEDDDLVSVAKKSLIFLAQNSDERGRVPFSVNPKTKLVKFRLPRSLDSTLWWLILFWLLTERYGDKGLKALLQENFSRSLDWLHYYLNYGLLEQGEGADWADEMPRSGLVLFSNALWLIFLNLINSQKKYEIYRNFVYFFSNEKQPQKGLVELDKQFPHWQTNKNNFFPKNSYFIASVSRVTVDTSFDILGNILACLSGLVPTRKVNDIIKEIVKSKAAIKVPIRVLAAPRKVQQGVFEEYKQNKPWHYHNAGAWPFAGGFWVYLLARYGKIKQAQADLFKLAQVNSLNNWEFNEWFHGRNNHPMGVKRQTWNAATYILAYNAVVNNKYIL